MVIAHLGHPWYGEAISVIRKRQNAYGDCSTIFCNVNQFTLGSSLPKVDMEAMEEIYERNALEILGIE